MSGFRLAYAGALLLVLLAAAGCAPTTTATDVRAVNCTGWRAICVDDESILSDPLVRQILRHNERGLARGCWTMEACGAGTDPQAEP